jgi:hypothetical protein
MQQVTSWHLSTLDIHGTMGKAGWPADRWCTKGAAGSSERCCGSPSLLRTHKGDRAYPPYHTSALAL